jgi:hypothetical protein
MDTTSTLLKKTAWSLLGFAMGISLHMVAEAQDALGLLEARPVIP